MGIAPLEYTCIRLPPIVATEINFFTPPTEESPVRAD